MPMSIANSAFCHHNISRRQTNSTDIVKEKYQVLGDTIVKR